MATGKITLSAVKQIPLPVRGKRAYLWDSELKGFGCMVTDKGAKSYLVQYRIGGRGSKTKRVTIGKHGSPWTPETARQRAKEILEQVWRKVDPYEAQKEAQRKESDQATADIKRQAQLSTLAFDNIVASYSAKASKKLRRWPEQAAGIARDLAPAFGSTPLTEISADDINDQLAVVAERSPSAARKAYVTLRSIYKHAHETKRRLFPKSLSPFDEVLTPEAGGKRERHLTHEELRLYWEATKSLGWPFGPIYQLLALTGLRLRGVAQGRWSEIDFEERRWNLASGDRTKNGKPHWVHLSGPALAILQNLPRVGSVGGDLMFSTNGVNPVSGFGRGKKRLNAAMEAIKAAEAANPDAANSPVQPFVIHDLRRTFTRGCQRLGYAQEVVDRLLGHITYVEGGLRGVYSIYDFESERVQAFERWGNEVLRISNGGPARLIAMKGAA